MRHSLTRTVAAAVILFVAGCAGAPVKKKEAAVFYPPVPDLPRIQYLASFSGSKDIEKQSAFNKFVVGEKGDIKLSKPYGVGIYDGKIYVCDTNRTVMVFDFKNHTFGPLDGARGPGKLLQPLNISITPDGTKYVTDPVRGQVVVFDRNDQYVRAYGMPGDWKPVDAVLFGDRVYVSDIENGLVKVFDKMTGEPVATIGNKGEASQRLFKPTDLAFDRKGNLYVTDFGKFHVIKYDRDGHYLGTLGKLGDLPGNFSRPRGLAFDKDNRLYVVDAAFNNVQLFNKDGRILMFFGSSSDAVSSGALMLPAGIAIDYNDIQYFKDYVDPSFEPQYLIAVTSQFGKRLVNLYAFGKEKGQKYPTDEELQKKIEEKLKQEQEQTKEAQEKAKKRAEEAEKKAAEKKDAGSSAPETAPEGK
jgi:sugar lactone lactonase YvrE/6-pyruvoyl-tetrahydropterin synthase